MGSSLPRKSAWASRSPRPTPERWHLGAETTPLHVAELATSFLLNDPMLRTHLHTTLMGPGALASEDALLCVSRVVAGLCPSVTSRVHTQNLGTEPPLTFLTGSLSHP